MYTYAILFSFCPSPFIYFLYLIFIEFFFYIYFYVLLLVFHTQKCIFYVKFVFNLNYLITNLNLPKLYLTKDNINKMNVSLQDKVR